MYKLFLLSFFAIVLFAQNPKVYSALGDVIYDNVDNIAKLSKIDEYKIYKQKIQKYVNQVKLTKMMGFSLENGDKSINPKEYLDKLRKLSAENDFFVRSVDASFHEALERNNSALFYQIINSGLLNTQRYKKSIIDYYFQHSQEISTEGLIQKYLDEDAKLKAKREAQKRRYKSRKELERERIRRIRERDKKAQEALEKKLDEKLKKKKEQIREYQKEELSKTI